MANTVAISIMQRLRTPHRSLAQRHSALLSRHSNQPSMLFFAVVACALTPAIVAALHEGTRLGAAD